VWQGNKRKHFENANSMLEVWVISWQPFEVSQFEKGFERGAW
jgi:hypothetical protein